LRRRRRQSAALPSTEKIHPRSEDLDRCSIREIISRLHREDRRALEAVGRALNTIARTAEKASRSLQHGGRIIYVGAGTSGRIAVLDAAECPPTFGSLPAQVQAVLAGGRAAMNRSIEGAEDDSRRGRQAIRALKVRSEDFVCGISASARTPFVLSALKEAQRRGAETALVCCSPTPKRGIARTLVRFDTGPELIAGSTRLKAGTATKLALNAISTAAMVSLGKVYRGRMVDLKPRSEKLRLRAERIITDLTGLSPGRARRLLGRAHGVPRVALAMHFTGLGPAATARELERHSLRGLEMLARRS
jgi:N-acetylmuramic acid 6-phosphate etherase